MEEIKKIGPWVLNCANFALQSRRTFEPELDVFRTRLDFKIEVEVYRSSTRPSKFSRMTVYIGSKITILAEKNVRSSCKWSSG